MSGKKMRRYGVWISLTVGCLLIVILAFWQMSFQEQSAAGKLLSWSNACFAVAVAWGGIGLLALVARFDGFRALSYFGYVFRRKWTKRGKDSETPHLDNYYDYMHKKKKKESDDSGNRFVKGMLLPAGIYLAAAVVLTAGYYFV